MPIALLLQQSLSPLLRGEEGLRVWSAALRLETVLLAKARGAFLTHWFGTGLPRAGDRLRVHIGNIDALAGRYREVRAARRSGATGPNLLEPLASYVGAGLGMLISPTGGILFLFGLALLKMHGLLAALVGLIWGGLMSMKFGLLGFGALGIALIAAPILAIITAAGGLSALPALYETLSAAGRLTEALSEFLDQLTGPRERVRNPLVRALLGLLDRFAGLVAQLVGAAALFFTGIGPRLYGIVAPFVALGSLAREVFSLLGAVWTGLRGAFDALASNEGHAPWAVVIRTIDAIERLLFAALERAVMAIGETVSRLTDRVRKVVTALGGILRIQMALTLDHIASHPISRSIAVSIAQVEAARGFAASMLARPPSPATPSSGGFGVFAKGVIISGLAAAGLPTSLPAAPALPDAEAIMKSLGGEPSLPTADEIYSRAVSDPADPNSWVFFFDAATRANIEALLRTPGSAFAGERARLRAERLAPVTLAEGTTVAAEEALREQDLRYRDLIYAVLGRVLPPEARLYVPELLGTFEAIDAALAGQPPAEATPAFPVRDLPDNGRLRPVVRSLTVRGPEDRATELRAFSADLRRLMEVQVYLAPTPG